MTNPTSYETPQILHDAPLRATDLHHFHFDEFAVTLCRLIADKNTRTPLTIGVSGSWGSGKTTLLQRVREQLDATTTLRDKTEPALLKFANAQEDPQATFRICRTVWFDAWKYAGEEHLLAALLRVIVGEMQASGFWSKLKSARTGATETQLDWLKIVPALTKFISAGSFELTLDDVKVETPLKSATAFFDYFDASLDRLLASWVSGKLTDEAEIDEHEGALVIFIDDLDRCLPDKVVQVLETIKLFLDKRGCVFVLGADTNIVREAVAQHYKQAGFVEDNARDYLDKIIQIRFDLPQIGDIALQGYLNTEARTVLDEEVRRNWPVLVIGAGNNPRKVKAFANDLNLRWTMLLNAGEATGINRDDFTRWQVLLRVAPANFVKQLNNIDDLDLRHKFVMDALRWVQGDAGVEATFRDYATAYDLRRVLRTIQTFSDQFTPTALRAFSHLSALPAQPAPPPTPVETKPEAAPPVAVESKEEVSATEHIEMREPTRGRVEIPGPANVQTWGGMEFVRIPAGKFLMGSKDDNRLAQENEKPQHSAEIPYDYWLARYPVTNEQFAKFVEEAAYKFGLEENWKKKADHPAVNVSWHDAMEYCKWLNTLAKPGFPSQGLVARLPTEAEWEKAARGEYGNEWPWGNEFDPSKCNSSEGKKGGTTPSGVPIRRRATALMALQIWPAMCGNGVIRFFKPYPYKRDDGREDESASGRAGVAGRRVLPLSVRRALCVSLPPSP